MLKKGMEDVTIIRQSKNRLTCEISYSQPDLYSHGTSKKGLETNIKNSNCESLNISGP